MAQSCFPRRLRSLVILAVLSVSLSLPALALFDQEASGGQAPIAENFSLSTYRDVAISGTFSGVDPQGGALTFRVTKNPARGAVTQAEEGSARFTYSPYENKTGKDSFTYVAVDEAGNVSQPAKVSIRIEKPDTKVTYADMDGNPAHKAAISLAERGIFVGEQMGETWFFRPEASVTREEFLTMAMDTVEMDTLPQVQMTGFADDESISTWARPYVASALGAGMIQGGTTAAEGTSFAPGRVITRAEAAVMLDRLLQVSDVADQGEVSTDAAPAWAYQSVLNLSAVGVLGGAEETEDTLSAPLTRAQAAQMLQSAIEVLDFRKEIW